MQQRGRKAISGFISGLIAVGGVELIESLGWFGSVGSYIKWLLAGVIGGVLFVMIGAIVNLLHPLEKNEN